MGDWLGVAARVDSNASTLGPARPSAARRSAKGRHAGATASFPATFPAGFPATFPAKFPAKFPAWSARALTPQLLWRHGYSSCRTQTTFPSRRLASRSGVSDISGKSGDSERSR